MSTGIDEGPLPPRFAGARTGSIKPEPSQVTVSFDAPLTELLRSIGAVLERLAFPQQVVAEQQPQKRLPALVVETVNAVLARDGDLLSSASREELYALIGGEGDPLAPALVPYDHTLPMDGSACCARSGEHACQTGEPLPHGGPHHCPCGFEWTDA